MFTVRETGFLKPVVETCSWQYVYTSHIIWLVNECLLKEPFVPGCEYQIADELIIDKCNPSEHIVVS